MLNVTVARCKEVIMQDASEMRTLCIIQAVCGFLALLFIVFGPPIVAVIPVILSFLLMMVQAHLFKDWEERFKNLLDACRNVRVDFDF